jgi:hypothetical protein
MSSKFDAMYSGRQDIPNGDIRLHLNRNSYNHL